MRRLRQKGRGGWHLFRLGLGLQSQLGEGWGLGRRVLLLRQLGWGVRQEELEEGCRLLLGGGLLLWVVDPLQDHLLDSHLLVLIKNTCRRGLDCIDTELLAGVKSQVGYTSFRRFTNWAFEFSSYSNVDLQQVSKQSDRSIIICHSISYYRLI